MKFAATFLSFAFLIDHMRKFTIIPGNINGRGLRPRIIGGDDAEIEDFPYQASLRFLNYHFCAGSIISEKHILTAAHCINVLSPFMNVHTGTGRTDEFGTVHNVANIKVHPDWIFTKESSYRNDIAVITLTEKISFDKYQKKIDLASKDVQSGVNANQTGWGRTKSGSAAIQLQKLETTILANTDCQKDQSDEIYEEQVCAFHSKGVGMCFGDSGGPLAVDGELIGIASWVYSKGCIYGVPDVFTNVYAYRDFIESVIE